DSGGDCAGGGGGGGGGAARSERGVGLEPSFMRGGRGVNGAPRGHCGIPSGRGSPRPPSGSGANPASGSPRSRRRSDAGRRILSANGGRAGRGGGPRPFGWA